MLVSIEARDFCRAAARLGESTRLLTWSADGTQRTELEAGGISVCAASGPDDFDEAWLADAVLLHVTAADLARRATRRALDLAKGRQALLALDLVAAGDASAGARLVLDLALLRPDILLVGEAQREALGAPLEGLARLPVLVLGDRGVELFGRRVPAPPGAAANRDAFTAALCSAYLDGAMPVEAAGRAMVFAASS